MTLTKAEHAAEVGDLIVIAGHHVGESERIAGILRVIDELPSERYRVRWDDGRENVYFPGSDAERSSSTRHTRSPKVEAMTAQARTTKASSTSWSERRSRLRVDRPAGGRPPRKPLWRRCPRLRGRWSLQAGTVSCARFCPPPDPTRPRQAPRDPRRRGRSSCSRGEDRRPLPRVRVRRRASADRR